MVNLKELVDALKERLQRFEKQEARKAMGYDNGTDAIQRTPSKKILHGLREVDSERKGVMVLAASLSCAVLPRGEEGWVCWLF